VTGPRERFRTRHVYVLGGRIICGICDRKMQGHWANETAYYRCRFPAEYAVANKVSHPLNVFVRERHVMPELDRWLAREFAPRHLEETIEQMTAAQASTGAEVQAIADARDAIRDCEAKMTRYRAAIDAGGDIGEITSWINQAKAERLQAEAALRTAPAAPRRLTRQEINTIVERFASLAAVIRDADPADIYKGLNLALTYQPGTPTVRAEVRIGACDHGVMVGVRGGT